MRVVHEIESKFVPSPVLVRPIAKCVEALKRSDAWVKDAAAALALDILEAVARETGDDVDALFGEEVSRVFLAWLLEDGEIAAVQNAASKGACAFDECAEIRMHFRGAAGDVERRDL